MDFPSLNVGRHHGPAIGSPDGQLHESSEISSLTTVDSTTTNSTMSNSNSTSTLNSNGANQSLVRKNLKTEYKSNFRPFDQYVYNSATDTFVRQATNDISPTSTNQQQGSKQELQSSSNKQVINKSTSISASNSNQNLNSPTPPDLMGGNAHDAVVFEPTNGRLEQSNADPWYKEVQRRNEKANEYRFKSEIGHQSPFSSQAPVHIAYETSIGGASISPANSHHVLMDDTHLEVRSQYSANGDQQQAAPDSTESMPPVRSVYRFTPSDYKRDNMIAHMANNNNFNPPKERSQESQRPATSRLAAAKPTAANPIAPGSRSLARSAASSRARSQSSRRVPISTASAVTTSSTKTTPTTAKSSHTTPVRSRINITNGTTPPGPANSPSRPLTRTPISASSANKRPAVTPKTASSSSTPKSQSNVAPITSRRPPVSSTATKNAPTHRITHKPGPTAATAAPKSTTRTAATALAGKPWTTPLTKGAPSPSGPKTIGGKQKANPAEISKKDSPVRNDEVRKITSGRPSLNLASTPALPSCSTDATPKVLADESANVVVPALVASSVAAATIVAAAAVASNQQQNEEDKAIESNLLPTNDNFETGPKTWTRDSDQSRSELEAKQEVLSTDLLSKDFKPLDPTAEHKIEPLAAEPGISDSSERGDCIESSPEYAESKPVTDTPVPEPVLDQTDETLPAAENEINLIDPAPELFDSTSKLSEIQSSSEPEQELTKHHEDQEEEFADKGELLVEETQGKHNSEQADQNSVTDTDSNLLTEMPLEPTLTDESHVDLAEPEDIKQFESEDVIEADKQTRELEKDAAMNSASGSEVLEQTDSDSATLNLEDELKLANESMNDQDEKSAASHSALSQLESDSRENLGQGLESKQSPTRLKLEAVRAGEDGLGLTEEVATHHDDYNREGVASKQSDIDRNDKENKEEPAIADILGSELVASEPVGQADEYDDKHGPDLLTHIHDELPIGAQADENLYMKQCRNDFDTDEPYSMMPIPSDNTQSSPKSSHLADLLETVAPPAETSTQNDELNPTYHSNSHGALVTDFIKESVNHNGGQIIRTPDENQSESERIVVADTSAALTSANTTLDDQPTEGDKFEIENESPKGGQDQDVCVSENVENSSAANLADPISRESSATSAERPIHESSYGQPSGLDSGSDSEGNTSHDELEFEAPQASSAELLQSPSKVPQPKPSELLMNVADLIDTGSRDSLFDLEGKSSGLSPAATPNPHQQQSELLLLPENLTETLASASSNLLDNLDHNLLQTDSLDLLETKSGSKDEPSVTAEASDVNQVTSNSGLNLLQAARGDNPSVASDDGEIINDELPAALGGHKFDVNIHPDFSGYDDNELGNFGNDNYSEREDRVVSRNSTDDEIDNDEQQKLTNSEDEFILKPRESAINQLETITPKQADVVDESSTPKTLEPSGGNDFSRPEQNISQTSEVEVDGADLLGNQRDQQLVEIRDTPIAESTKTGDLAVTSDNVFVEQINSKETL